MEWPHILMLWLEGNPFQSPQVAALQGFAPPHRFTASVPEYQVAWLEKMSPSIRRSLPLSMSRTYLSSPCQSLSEQKLHWATRIGMEATARADTIQQLWPTIPAKAVRMARVVMTSTNPLLRCCGSAWADGGRFTVTPPFGRGLPEQSTLPARKPLAAATSRAARAVLVAFAPSAAFTAAARAEVSAAAWAWRRLPQAIPPSMRRPATAMIATRQMANTTMIWPCSRLRPWSRRGPGRGVMVGYSLGGAAARWGGRRGS